MARPRKCKVLVGDFETTVYKGQTYTEVWASALVEIGTEDVKIFHSINETFDYIKELHENLIIYYHNLKFDGSFWMSYLLKDLKFKQAFNQPGDYTTIEFIAPAKMKNNSFIYSISDMGQWYRLIFKVNGRLIELRDSLKLLPFSVKEIGKSFGTVHKKTDIEYTGFRYAGCEITEKERGYITNDVLVVKEALEIMFTEKHNKLTIGSCCLAEYKALIGIDIYKKLFPDLYQVEIDPEIYGKSNAGEYIRLAYHGGWVYVVPEKAHKILKNGITADVNSLYPSVMHSESGSRYPYGLPTFWRGDYLPSEASTPYTFYYIRIRTRFYLKPGKLPFIQVKNNGLYKATEVLKTSDVYNRKTNSYHAFYLDVDGTTKPATVTMTLTQMDYKLLQEHYDLADFEILDGCYFMSEIGLFDRYINKYRRIKETSTGAKRTLAKLFLNNLYGKLASNTNSSFKFALLNDEGVIEFIQIEANNKEPGYIAVGAAITSYARNFTIRAAQLNYYGPDKPGFVYADTDSCHMDAVTAEELKGIPVHKNAFCHWKLESSWDTAYFVRAKTYIEHNTHENLEPIEPYYNVKCAGMPDTCKRYLLASMGYEKIENLNTYPKEVQDFVNTPRTLENFDYGLEVPGKLVAKRIPGGTLLVDTTYTMQ